MSVHNKVLTHMTMPHMISASEAQAGAFEPMTQSQSNSPTKKLTTAIQPQTVLSFIGVILYSAMITFNFKDAANIIKKIELSNYNTIKCGQRGKI